MWTLQKIKVLLAARKIRGYLEQRESVKTVSGKIVAKHFKKRSKEKDWISWNLWVWAQERGYKLFEEYRFDSTRKWRFDWFLVVNGQKCGIEYEGINSNKSRHTSMKGYSGDSDKYRAAAKAGFIVLRYTILNYKTIISDLCDIKENGQKSQ